MRRGLGATKLGRGLGAQKLLPSSLSIPQGVVSPGPGKRKREQTEEESQGRPSRSLRRTKPIQESTAPKVGEKGHGASWEMEMREDGWRPRGFGAQVVAVLSSG